jgi:hypothetical protein
MATIATTIATKMPMTCPARSILALRNVFWF